MNSPRSSPADERPATSGDRRATHLTFHDLDVEDALDSLQVRAECGLSADEAALRLAEFGPNTLRTAKRRSDWAILIDQFKNLLALLLALATAVSFAFGDHAEGMAILAVILINGFIGFWAERKAVKSIDALRQLGVTQTTVRRDGEVMTLPAEQLVPGDIVLLEAGDVITADLRLVKAARLQCDESLLTGESVPVEKSTAPVAADAAIDERAGMAFKGTAVTRGTGEAVVVATGAATELGQISTLVEAAEDEVTPLEKRLQRMSRQLMWVALAIAALVLAVGVMSGRDALLMVKTGIALAIAAIPEGLPIVATLALGRGMWRLARRNALVERLSAVETLGAVTVIFTDKTGTLTENQMRVEKLVLPAGEITFSADGAERGGADAAIADRAAHVLCLCTSAKLKDQDAGTGIGDPMELALLQAARKLDVDIEVGEKVGEEAFDPETRMMATQHRCADKSLITVKGAPEAVLARAETVAAPDGDRPMTDAERQAWTEQTQLLAAGGQRVLALADRRSAALGGDPYAGLTFLGLVALQDPPRADARPAVEAARRAGIKVVMMTGDKAETGSAIAHAVGLTDQADSAVVEGKDLRPPEELAADDRRRLRATQVFARVSPKQKLDLIALFQEAGEIVAMTGDGVNDAPALKKADIGVAMGLRGTQVAKEAADLVLKDDAFASIIAAIRQGRVIFANIRKFVLYLLSCNVSEVLVVAVATASGLPLPLMPLQILFLNLVTDVFPALAVGVSEGDRGILSRPPRDPKESILARRHWLAVGLYGVIITAAVMGAFLWALSRPEKGPDYPVTVAFLTLALAQMWHVFNMRSRWAGLFRNQLVLNPYVWGALALCGLLLIGALYLPPIADVLNLVEPDAAMWGVVLSASLFPLLAGQLLKAMPVGRPPRAATQQQGHENALS